MFSLCFFVCFCIIFYNFSHQIHTKSHQITPKEKQGYYNPCYRYLYRLSAFIVCVDISDFFIVSYQYTAHYDKPKAFLNNWLSVYSSLISDTISIPSINNKDKVIIIIYFLLSVFLIKYKRSHL